jgi:tRNA U34 5-carboxymethylaminomethyl modifying GTPase MnmE/TrmE
MNLIPTGDIFCLIFSFDNKQLFENVLVLLERIRNMKENKQVIIIGNKIDIGVRKVTHTCTDIITHCYDNVKYIETSAKENINIDTVRSAAINMALEKGIKKRPFASIRRILSRVNVTVNSIFN